MIAGGLASTSERVVVFDLDAESEIVRTRPISALQVERAPQAREGTLDLSRIVIIVSLSRLGDAADVIERVMLAPSVEKTICVVRGRPRIRGEAGPQLQLPETLRSSACVVLWVGDPQGVVWAVGVAKAKRLTVFESDPEGEGAFAALLECLHLPEVYDEVFERGQTANAVFSPALRIVVPGLSDPELLAGAEVAALETLTEAPEEIGEFELPEGLRHHPELLGKAKPPAELFAQDTGLGRTRALAEHARERALDVTRVLRTRATREQVAETQSVVAAVGDAISDLRDGLRELFSSVEATNGLDTNERRLLKRAGVLDSVLNGYTGQVSSSEREEEAREFALAEIRDYRSLAQVAALLRGLAARATPRSSEDTVALIEKACPVAVIERLRARSRLELLGATPGALLAIAGLVAAATWWPGAWRLIPFILLLGLAAFFSWVVADRWLGFQALLDNVDAIVRRVALWERSGAAIAGLTAGLIVQFEAGSLALEIIGIIGFVALLPAYAVFTWRASIADWVLRSGLPSAGEAIERLTDAAREVAINDWLIANERAHFARTATRLAEAVNAMRQTLLEAAKQVRMAQKTQLPGLLCNPAIRADLSAEGIGELYKHARVIEEIVLSDHLDALTRSIEAEWPLLTARAGEKAPEQINGRLQTWITGYRRVLAERGLFGSDASHGREDGSLSADGQARRRELLRELWQGLDLDIMLADTSELVQYCTAEDLILLNQERNPELVRFVPSGRATNGQERLVFTSSMLMAGVLRLVELRPGSVSFHSERSVALTGTP